MVALACRVKARSRHLTTCNAPLLESCAATVGYRAGMASDQSVWPGCGSASSGTLARLKSACRCGVIVQPLLYSSLPCDALYMTSLRIGHAFWNLVHAGSEAAPG